MLTTIQPRKADSTTQPLRPREVFRRWLVMRHYSPATVNCYVSRLVDYAAFFAKAPAELGPEQVNDYLSHLANDVHTRLETTMIYIHVAAPVEKRIKSPLDL